MTAAAQALSFVQLPMQARQAPATAPASAGIGLLTVIEVQIQRGETTVVVSLPMIR
jgi:hypothetical protein